MRGQWLMASGKELELAAMRDAATGVRVRVWNKRFSASAEGDAELVVDQKPEPWVGAAFDPRKHRVSYAGAWPSSLAFRRNDVPCLVADDATLLVLRAKKWAEPRRRGRTGSKPFLPITPA